MKTTTLFIMAFIVVIISKVNAQCTALASAFGNNTATTSYNISGTNSVQVVLNTNNTITLNLMSNFATANGPDVNVYLVAPGAMTDFMLKNAVFTSLTKIKFGLVSNIGNGMGGTTMASGAKTFTVAIPTGQNISNYTKVFFHCDNFNAFWDLGTINAFTAGNCALLGLDKFIDSEQFKLYPNPASNVLNISSDDISEKNTSFKIYNSLGSLVFKIKNSLQNNIDVSSLKNGIYFIEIETYDGKKAMKRFIKV